MVLLPSAIQSRDDCIQISKHQPALRAFLETKQDTIKDMIGEGTKVLIFVGIVEFLLL